MLLADGLQRVEIGQSVADISRFLFSSRRRYLGFVVRVFSPPRKSILVVFIIVQNLVGIDAVVSIICMFYGFREIGLKIPIHAPTNWVLGDITPEMWSDINETQKDTSLRESASFEPSCAKIRRRV